MSKGDYFWVKHFKSKYELLPFGVPGNLIAKMYNTSKFWSIKFMDADFFYHSIYDRFIRRQPRAYVRPLILSLKNFSETIDWIFTKIQWNAPWIEAKKVFLITQRNISRIDSNA